ncbi:adenylosuccinate synthetase [Candidatus Woesearchaeota archaeon]|nr:adenylosuccinate synthetase [Candidatus Woesearchaeota archaeon]
MPSTIVVGTQWGDEGKAKILDFLARNADYIIRVQGGANAGHTQETEEIKFVSHSSPGGILYPDKIGIVGNGVVFDIGQFISEVNELKRKGIDVKERVWIASNAHLVMPWHKALDGASDSAKGKKAIGTTGRGIGPCYSDKALRINIRAKDTLNEDKLSKRIDELVEQKNKDYERYGIELIPDNDAKEIFSFYRNFGKEFGARIRDDITYMLRDARKAGKNLLYEGAQGTFLDIDHGTYPFVTSSNTIAGGACTGAGVGPTTIDEVIGIVKAYTTRVGRGPFVTEIGGEKSYEHCEGEERDNHRLGDELKKYNVPFEETKDGIKYDHAHQNILKLLNSNDALEKSIGLRLIGEEFGATTGRPRRCGWLDGVMVDKAQAVNGLTGIAITKLDCLDRFNEIPICTGYKIDGKTTNIFPTDLERAEPVYETLPGWMKDISGIRDYNKLPDNAKRYAGRLEELAGAPAVIISVGPKREQTIDVR